MEEYLSQVLETEKEAQELVKAAEAEAERMIAEARGRADELLAEAEGKAQKRLEELQRQAEAEAQAEVVRLEEAHGQRVEALEQRFHAEREEIIAAVLQHLLSPKG